MTNVQVRHETADRFSVRIRDHVLVVDQPREIGGEDEGPTPTELFVASLAACIAFYAQRFVRRHVADAADVSVDCDFLMSEISPSRVESVRLSVTVPDGFPESRLAALERVIDHCTVHNSLRVPPNVQVLLVSAQQAA